MRIAFYAPLKAPDHPVPSGDREMARLLLAALRASGHGVEVLSTLRTFTPTPDPAAVGRVAAEAKAETNRLAARWVVDPSCRPDLVFAYHLYYKAPDLIGQALARRFGLPYATAEASHAAKRLDGPWREGQRHVDAAVRDAAINLCFTANDRAGLATIVGPERLANLTPFIDPAPFESPSRDGRGGRIELVTVAMMRPGDKLDSYVFLASALARVEADWRLTIVGDGPARMAVEAAMAALRPGRVRFAGQLRRDAIAAALAASDLFVWPGFNEAFGLCYLEAQACGLPVVAVMGEGTPSVILDAETGVLTRPEVGDYADAVALFIADAGLRLRLGRAATLFVRQERTVRHAADRLDAALRKACATARPAGAVA